MAVDKASSSVRRMFASVAHRYDFLNRLLSLSIDRWWRRVARRKLLGALPARPLILDLCTGTGDVAFTFAPDGKVVGCDFCRPMLEVGIDKAVSKGLERQVSFVEADALVLPFPEASFDGVTIAFGLRNLEDFRQGLQEMLRVLRPGGCLAILEFSIPTLPVIRPLYLWYFTRVLPRIGALVSGADGPYSYLPASVQQFPTPEELVEILSRIGFERPRAIGLTFRIASLYLAAKPR